MSVKKNIEIPADSSVTRASTNTDFKDSFLGVLKESNSARNELRIVVCEALRMPETIADLKEIVNSVDRDAIKVFWGKFGFTVWTAIVFVLGVIATTWIQNFFE
jgi:hypothetical protein